MPTWRRCARCCSNNARRRAAEVVMLELAIIAAVSWLLSYLLHSSVLLGLLWGAERAGALRRLPRAGIEWLWRAALFGGLLTASLQTWQSLPVAAAESSMLLSAASPDPVKPALATAPLTGRSEGAMEVVESPEPH